MEKEFHNEAAENDLKKGLEQRIEELKNQASRDPLTGLLNRMTVERRINSRLGELKKEDASALFMVDLDDFKEINDTLGHQAGDQAILRAAQIMGEIFGKEDIVGRLGGDEFLAFISGSLSEEYVCQKAADICEGLQMALGDIPSMNLTASVGVFLSKDAKVRFKELYRGADQALYVAKKTGKRGFCLKCTEETSEDTEEFREVNTIPVTGLLEYMDDAVALVEMGQTPRLIYVSPSFFKILKLEENAFSLPKKLMEIVHPDDWLELEKILRRGVAGEKSVELTHRISTDGQEWRWWHIRAARIKYSNDFPVLLVTATDVSNYKEQLRQVHEENQRLKIALIQTTRSLWEVELSQKQLYLYSKGKQGLQMKKGPVPFPDWLLQNGWIHPDSLPRFRKFAEDILQGRPGKSGNFIIRNDFSGCYGWASIAYQLTYDQDGNPNRAIGIIENLPQNLVVREAESVLGRPLPEALRQDLMIGMKGNLTKDIVEEMWVEGESQGKSIRDMTCTQALSRIHESLFYPRDKENLRENFCPDFLREAFRQGRAWHVMQYTCVDGSGSIRDVGHIQNLVRDPSTGDIFLFVYICHTDRHRSWEKAVKDLPLWDPATGLYDKRAAFTMARSIMGQKKPEACAAAVIGAAGLARLCRGDKHMLEKAIYDLGAAFRVALGADCILTRCQEEALLAFFPFASSQNKLRQKLEEGLFFVRLVMGNRIEQEQIRLVAAVSVQEMKKGDLDDMVSQALRLLQYRQHSPVDTVAFVRDEEGFGEHDVFSADPADTVAISLKELERPLSEEEKDLTLRCMGELLSGQSREASVQGVLGYIGEYYQADRIYLLEVSGSGQVVTMPCEWVRVGKKSIQQAVSGTTLERFPILIRCTNEGRPVTLSKTAMAASEKSPREGRAPSENKTWNFMVFPLMNGKRPEGFLCVENAGKHPADAAFFTAILPFIFREKAGFQKRGAEGLRKESPSMELPNLKAYTESIREMTGERYNTLGAVCLDIPNFSGINSSLGFEYGNQMIDYVIRMLTEIFGSEWIFRTWDAEFVALCPNTTRQVFEGRCFRLRSHLQRRYFRDVRLGYCWSDGDFRGKDLVKEARDLSRKGRELLAADPGDFSQYYLDLTGERRLQNRLDVYLQPIVDIKTGQLYGAEALVRLKDEEGRRVPLGGMIEGLEQSGEIRKLDLFVLDRVLNMMEAWQKEGLETSRVSVNFSRVTLLGASAFASVLAIQSRYPSVLPSRLEIEITESAGEIGSSDLEAIIDPFRECGFRFSLDDFGSKYSNLSVFSNVHFDTVKLDQSLVRGLTGSQINRLLIEDILRICRGENRVVIAEGVETEQEASCLAEIGCVYAQGFYYDRPMAQELFKKKYLKEKDMNR